MSASLRRRRGLQHIGATRWWSKETDFGHDHMRSRLERDFARHLFDLDQRYEYEPRVFGPKGRRYLPDFRVTTPARVIYVEVKPTLAEVLAAQSKMSVIWEEEPGAMLMVACAEGCQFFAALRGEPWTMWVERWAHR